MKFNALPISMEIIHAVNDLGFTDATPIQEKVIPHILQGHDLCATAKTGSGKTASYTMPIIDTLINTRKRLGLARCLILVPTRELADQVASTFDELSVYTKKISYAVTIGGLSSITQEKKIKSGVDVIIATPGRLLDLYENNKINFVDIKTLVIDEVDRMLDMGFIPDVKKVMQILNPETQKLCFSATMPSAVKKIMDLFFNNPTIIKLESTKEPASNITQMFIKNAGVGKTKRDILKSLIKQENIDSAIIFCNRKSDIDTLQRSFSRSRLNSSPLHGDISQIKRTENLDNFKNKKTQYLIASDVAARGIDIDNLKHVINFDIPGSKEEYIHRIGRTGRAGNSGKSYTLIENINDYKYKRIKDCIVQDTQFIDIIPNSTSSFDTKDSFESKDLFSKQGYRKPSAKITSFAFFHKQKKGFGDATPKFIR